mgnify:CR=1 FL=1
MLFVLEYERDMATTIRRDIHADNYRPTGPEKDHIEFLRSGEPVFVVRRSSVVTIENDPQGRQALTPDDAVAGVR